MALLSRQDIIGALTRLGQLAAADGCTLRLVLVGGAAMVLGYDARESTQDVDAMFLPPPEAGVVRAWSAIIARENGWPEDWLNDAAKAYLTTLSDGPVLFEAQGIVARQIGAEQLLGMKLCAWRDDVDIADAARLLAVLTGSSSRNRSEVWRRIEPFLMPGRELKAQYAFDDLWESLYGVN
jgi:hypothetical protein